VAVDRYRARAAAETHIRGLSVEHPVDERRKSAAQQLNRHDPEFRRNTQSRPRHLTLLSSHFAPRITVSTEAGRLHIDPSSASISSTLWSARRLLGFRSAEGGGPPCKGLPFWCWRRRRWRKEREAVRPAGSFDYIVSTSGGLFRSPRDRRPFERRVPGGGGPRAVPVEARVQFHIREGRRGPEAIHVEACQPPVSGSRSRPAVLVLQSIASSEVMAS
jgi:hypothetical protein